MDGAIHDEQAQTQSLEWRRVQSRVRAQLQAPFASADAVLDVLVPTLSLLDLLPSTIPNSVALKHSPDRVYGLNNGRNAHVHEEFVKAFSRRTWLQTIQQAILGAIAVDWRRHLGGQHLWLPLLRAWFAPRPRPRSGLIAVTDDDDDGNDDTYQQSDFCASVTSSGLEVCIDALSRMAREDVLESITAAVTEVLGFYTNSHDSLPLLDCVLADAKARANPAERRLQWEAGVTALVSLPARTANAYKGNVPPGIALHAHLPRLYTQMMAFMERPNTRQDDAANPLAHLLTRLLRSGHIGGHTVPESRFEETFWGIALASAVKHCESVPQQGLQMSWSVSYTQNWQRLLCSLGSQDSRTLAIALLAALDQVARRQQVADLVSGPEQGHPAASGRAFLSPRAAKIVEIQACLLKFFFGHHRSAKCNDLGIQDDSSDDDDEEEDDDTLATVLERIILDDRRYFAPSTARVYATHLSSQPASLLEETLHTFVDRWGDVQRVKRATFEQEQFLACLMVALLVQGQDHKPIPSIAHSVARRKSFIEGVSAHLEHLDPRIRRMGMLLAEIVSERSHTELASEQASSSKSPQDLRKKLSFGNSAWDGVGDGREEARVLRAVHHASHNLHGNTDPTSRSEALELLTLQQEAQPLTALTSAAQDTDLAKARPQPTTRRLPAKVPAKPTPRSGGLIAEITSDMDEVHLRSSGAVSRQQPVESDAEESSSDSDSSADEGDVPDGFGEPDIPLRSGSGANKDTSATEEPFMVDTRKRPRPPVYIWEVSSMLREKDRDAVRVALKSAEGLIARKAGWGGEVDENAIDLAIVLVGLQNNFQIKSFEERRTRALAALVVASPKLTAGAVIEYFFTANYSIAQRFAVLNALASGARKLADQADLSSFAASKTQAALQDRKAVPSTAEMLATANTDSAIARAKAEGEERVPEIKREKAVKVTVTSQRPRNAIQELGPQTAVQHTLPGAVVRPRERFSDIASPVFLFPLMNRLSVHIDEYSARFSRLPMSSLSATATVTGGMGGPAKSGGAAFGTSTLFDPLVLSALVDTLSVLAHAAQNSLDFGGVVLPEALELALRVVGKALPLALVGAHSEGEQGRQGDDNWVAHHVHGACLSFALVVLDAASSSATAHLLRNHHSLLDDTAQWAAHVFEQLEGERPRAASLGDRGRGRAARASAAVVLRVEEIRSRAREERMRGFM